MDLKLGENGTGPWDTGFRDFFIHYLLFAAGRE